MSARLSCPGCGAVPKLADDLPPGKRIRCRNCGEVYAIPDDEDDDYDDERESRRPRRRRRQPAGSGAVLTIILAVVVLGALAVGAVAVVGLIGGKKEPSVANGPAQPVPFPPLRQQPPLGGPPPVVPAGPAVGTAAPEIDGEDIDGKRFKLSDYRGKVVLLDFWGNW